MTMKTLLTALGAVALVLAPSLSWLPIPFTDEQTS